MTELFTPKVAAMQLGIKESTLLRQIRSGVCRHRRIGHLIFLTESDINDMIMNSAAGGRGTNAGGRIEARREN